jgi:putative nucleotidyltransferase with HDIG domain
VGHSEGKQASAARADRFREQEPSVEQSIQCAIDALSAIGEISDPYTHAHERRVGAIAAVVAIAEELGFDADRVEGVRVAGYMHDIGKISIPAEILAKPARLSQAEYELIKGHTHHSHEILKRVHFPWPVAQAALQHHERFDGSGYPYGLKGDEILLEARILAVADVVEAMASHRPYRPGLGIAKALDEIREGRGTRYDPLVADACLAAFRHRGAELLPSLAR